MLKALFRIGFVSWFFVAAFSLYPHMKVAPYNKTGSQVPIEILLQGHLVDALN